MEIILGGIVLMLKATRNGHLVGGAELEIRTIIIVAWTACVFAPNIGGRLLVQIPLVEIVIRAGL